MADSIPLVDGERILWSGAPDQGRVFTSSDLFLVPFGVVCTLLGIGVVQQVPADANLVVAVMVGALVLFVVLGRFMVKAHMKRHTRYVLTSTRAVIVRPRRSTSFDLAAGSPHLEVLRHKRHNTLRFTSDDPRSYGKVANGLFANTGLDFLLRPGHDVRFAFHDVLRDGVLDRAIDTLTRDGVITEGIA